MKQIEITTRVNDKIDNLIKILEDNGFKLTRKGLIDDIYMTQLTQDITKDSISDILSKSVLLRTVTSNDNKFSVITYKNKVIENDIVLTEEKISAKCDELDKVKSILECLNITELIHIKDYYTVYSKNGFELCVQDVQNLGLLIEYENEDDFANSSSDEILDTKRKMLEEIKNIGINVSDDFDVKKAKELIIKKYNLESL